MVATEHCRFIADRSAIVVAEWWVCEMEEGSLITDVEVYVKGA